MTEVTIEHTNLYQAATVKELLGEQVSQADTRAGAIRIEAS